MAIVNKEIKRLRFSTYWWAILSLVILGLADSIYLSISHYRVYTDIGYKSFCALTRAVNCDTVSQSSYSILLGIPVPIWGVIGYGFLIPFLFYIFTLKTDRQRIWAFLEIILAVYCFYSLVLAYISAYFIHSYCIMCIGLYCINFFSLFFCGLVRRRFSSKRLINDLIDDLIFFKNNKKQVSLILIAFFLVCVASKAFIPNYWEFKKPPLNKEIKKGVTEDGHPWIGAEYPELTITEFSDYKCFQCKKMHFYLRSIVANYPDKVRLVHRHYPMDHEFNYIVKEPFHVGSAKLAMIAIYAMENGKFWQMNDILYDLAGRNEDISLRKIAKKLDLKFKSLARSVDDRQIRFKLQKDIWKGMKLRILGTPAYIVNNKVYQALLPPELLKKYLK